MYVTVLELNLVFMVYLHMFDMRIGQIYLSKFITNNVNIVLWIKNKN